MTRRDDAAIFSIRDEGVLDGLQLCSDPRPLPLTPKARS